MQLRQWYLRSLALPAAVLTWGLMTFTVAAGADGAEPAISQQQANPAAREVPAARGAVQGDSDCQAVCRQCHSKLAGLRRRCGQQSRHRRAPRAARTDALEVRRLQAALSDAHLALSSCQSSQPLLRHSRKELVVDTVEDTHSIPKIHLGSIADSGEQGRELNSSDGETNTEAAVKRGNENSTTESKSHVQNMDKASTLQSPRDEDFRGIASPFLQPTLGSWLHSSSDDLAAFSPVSLMAQRVEEEIAKFTPAFVDGSSDVLTELSEAPGPGLPSGRRFSSDGGLPIVGGLGPRGSASASLPAGGRALGSSGSQDSSASASSGSSEEGHDSHQHDALLFLFNAIIIGTIILHLTMMPKFEGLQQTVTLFVIGVLYSILQEWMNEHLGVFGKSYHMWMEINPHTLMFTMLPVLLTGDAMTIDTAIARRVANQCVYLAGPGVLIQAFLIAGFLQVYLPHDWSFLLCLVMGAIFAATDPVAVVGLLKELGASPVLTVQIQGESLLNDGTAIVLYTIAYQMLKGAEYDVGELIVILVKTALCAAGLGAVIGWFFVIWIRSASNRLDHHSCMIQISLTLCCAYWSFIISEGVLHISGVLCTVCSALVMADKMWPSIINKEAMSHVWHMLEYLGNTLIFFLAGALTGNIMTRMPLLDYLHLIVIYIVTFIIRTGFLFGSRPILKYLSPKREPVSASEAMVMSWGGLRGAVGLALAIQVSIEGAGGRLEELDANRVLFYTGGVAALTLTVNATTCPALVRWLGITQTPWAKRKMMKCIHTQLERLADRGKHPAPVHRVLHNLLAQVHHEMDKVVEKSGQLEEKRKSLQASIKRLSLSRSGSRLSQLEAGNDKNTVPDGKLLVERHSEMKELVTNLPSKVIECGLVEFPEIPYESHSAEIEGLILDHAADPLLVRTVNEAFLSLVRAQYWKSIDAGEFERTTHAELLLSSVTSAYNRAHVSLVDLRFVLKELDALLVKKLGRTGWKAKLRTYHATEAEDDFVTQEDEPQLNRQLSSASNNSSKPKIARQKSSADDAVNRANSLASEIRASIHGTRPNCRCSYAGSEGSGPVTSASQGSRNSELVFPRRSQLDVPGRTRSSELTVPSTNSELSVPNRTSELNALRLTGAPNSGADLQLPKADNCPTQSAGAGWENSVDDWFASKRLEDPDEQHRPTTVKKDWGEIRSMTKRAVGKIISFKSSASKWGKNQDVHELKRMTFVQRLVDSKLFTLVLALAIILNAIFMWAEENFRTDQNDENKVWFIVDTGFLVIFSAEFLCKLAAMKLWYCFDAWNLFDFMLVVLGVISLCFELMLHMEKEGTDVAGEARLIRLTRVFRVLRILRIFRLAGFYSILKAKLMHQDFSQNVAESLQSVTCLSAFVKAHIKSQEELVRFTGGIEDGQLIVEVARCIIESRTSVYQALALAVVEASQMDGETILAMNMMRECNVAADELTDFVLDAHKSGMLNTREAETFLHPLRHCMHEVLHQRQQSIMGFRRQMSTRVNNRNESVYGIERIVDEAKEALGHQCSILSDRFSCDSKQSNGNGTPLSQGGKKAAGGSYHLGVLSSSDEEDYDSDDDPQDTLREILQNARANRASAAARKSDSALPSETCPSSPAQSRSDNRNHTAPTFSTIMPETQNSDQAAT